MDEDLCAFVRAKVFANAAMATEDNMGREAQHWIETEGGVLPPGNGADAKRWSMAAELSSDDEAATPEAAPVISPFSQATVRSCPAPHWHL